MSIASFPGEDALADTFAREAPQLPRPASTLLEEARALVERSAFEDARARLREARNRFPRVADHIALREAELELAAGRPEEALALYASAELSVTPSVRVEARVGRVHALFELDDPRAREELPAVLAAYPEQPRALSLRVAGGRADERAGRTAEAVITYRDIDLHYPGTSAAGEARRRLARLAGAGISVPPYTLDETIARASRLVTTGPGAEAQHTVQELLARSDLDATHGALVRRLGARIARSEGRFAEADRLDREARALEPPVVAEMPAVTAETDPMEAARADIRRFSRGRPLTTMNTLNLPVVAQIAAASGLEDELGEALTAALEDGVPARVRFHVAMIAAGGAHDERVLEILEGLEQGTDDVALAARYHRARTLERLGRREEARDALRELAESRETNDYYALWARQRLVDMDRPSEHMGHEDDRVALRTPSSMPSLSLDEAADMLTTLAEAHARAYPWIGRAEDLLRLGQKPQAQRELAEAYRAWREKPRYSPVRSLLLALDGRDRAVLADVAAAIGEHRTAIELGTRYHGSDRPRAYEAEVNAAARRYGVDPNLILAVMRVESVFQPRVVSYAGAIGLMQIMPRTGEQVAAALARGDFTVDDLRDPRTNIEFGAWYLASLLERFDGRVPLALASYNGGPHNVRDWIEAHADEMPVDALLERIPFEQTHRYVRRVLVHYAAYRAQQGLPMVELPVEMPELRPDTVGF